MRNRQSHIHCINKISSPSNAQQPCFLPATNSQSSLRSLATNLESSEKIVCQFVDAGMPIKPLDDARNCLQTHLKIAPASSLGSGYEGAKNLMNQPHGWGR
jgi:hypothetical protein